MFNGYLGFRIFFEKLQNFNLYAIEDLFLNRNLENSLNHVVCLNIF